MQPCQSLPPALGLAVCQELLKLAAKRPSMAAQLLQSSRRLLERFQSFYRALCQLPRPARRRLQRRLALSLAGTALALALSRTPVAFASSITVTTSDPNVNADGQCSLIEAIVNANNDAQTYADCAPGSGADTLVLSGNTYSLTAAFPGTLSGLARITSAITIEGNGATLQRNSTAQFRMATTTASGNLTLKNLTLRGGNSSNKGGAVYNTGTLNLVNCTLAGNVASGGGGAIFNLGTVTLSNSTLSGNRGGSEGGGGLFNQTGGGATLTNSAILDNLSLSDGGAIRNAGVLTMSNSTMSDNTTQAKGGGIFNQGTAMLNNNTIIGNSTAAGGSGGGILNQGVLTLNQNLIFGSHAGSPWQEIVQEAGELHVDNYNLFGHNLVSTADALVGFTPGPTDITATSDGAHPTALTALANGRSGPPPQFNPLIAGSPAVDAIPLAVCTVSGDQRGVTRPQGPACDIGAFELQQDAAPTATPTDTPTPTALPTPTPTATPVPAGSITVTTSNPNVNADGQCSLIEAIVNANNDAQTHADCAPGSGADIIVLSGNTYTLTAIFPGTQGGLPRVTSPITIEGNGAMIQRTSAITSLRLFGTATSGNLTLKNLTLRGGNPGDLRGGAIYNTGTLTLANCTLTGNTASDGGAIFNLGTLTLNNSTLTGNQAQTRGGAIANLGSATLNNNTVLYNSATVSGGGIFNQGTLTLNRNLIVSNSAGGAWQEIVNTVSGVVQANNYNLFGHSLVSTAGALAGFTRGAKDRTATSNGTHPTGLAAILNPALADNGVSSGRPTRTHALVAGSPALDAIPLAVCTMTNDQRGFTRPSGPACDIGAFEFGAVPVGAIKVTTNNPAVNTGDSQCSLPEAIISANIDTAFGGCTTGTDGADTVVLSGNTYSLTAISPGAVSGLPHVTSPITIEGNGATILRDSAAAHFPLAAAETSGNLTLKNLTLRGGNSDMGGGAVYNAGTLTLVNCTLTDNTASDGGAIANLGTAILNNSTLTGNQAQTRGGAIANLGIVTLNNSTVTNNSAAVDGGGIYNVDILIGTLTLNQSVIVGNKVGPAWQELVNTGGGVVQADNYNLFGHNLVNTATALVGFTPGASDRIATSNGTHPTALAAILNSTLANNGVFSGPPIQTHALIRNSPAVDAIPLAVCTVSGDQRGVARPQGPACDIGAFELAPIFVTTSNPNFNAGDGQCSLIEAIISANNDTAAGDCPPGNAGADTIVLPANSVHRLITRHTGINSVSFTTVGLPTILSTISIEGNGATIKCDPPPIGGVRAEFRAFQVAPTGTLTLNDLTVANCIGSGSSNRIDIVRSGGAINNYGTVALNNSTFSGNKASFQGGAIHNRGTATLTNSKVSGNQAGDTRDSRRLHGRGGGIYNRGTLTLNNSTISKNSLVVHPDKISGRGGGIYNSGTVTGKGNTIDGNKPSNIKINEAALEQPAAQAVAASSVTDTAEITTTLDLSDSIIVGAPGAGIEISGTVAVTLTGNVIAGNGVEIDNHGGLITSSNNQVGYGGDARSVGFTPSPSDVVPTGPLAEALCNVIPGPLLGIPSAAIDPHTPNQVAFSAPFVYPCLDRTHSALWDWGDGATSPGTVTTQTGAGRVADSHLFSAAGVYTVTLTLTDSVGVMDTASLTVTADAVNDAPIVASDVYTTVEDAPLTAAAPGVLFNDGDPENNPLSAVLVASPAHGTLVFNLDGSFTFTPTANFNGSDSFTYRASDGVADSDEASVNLTVTPVNDAPLAVSDSYTTTEDAPLAVTAPGVLANDSDAEDDTLFAVLLGSPAHGTLSFNVDGSFIYTPTADFNGDDGFTYLVSDGQADSTSVEVALHVSAVNDAPVAVDDRYSTNEDAPLNVDAPGVLTNDSDVENDDLTATLVDPPAHGVLSFNVDGSFSFTPTADFNGDDSFTYQLNDGQADADLATVNLTVVADNDAPLAVSDSYTTTEDVPLTVTAPGVLDNDSDVEEDSLTATLVTTPTHGSVILNLDGSFTYTPTADFNAPSGAPDSFSYQTNDGQDDSNVATVSLTVTPVNDAPVAAVDSYDTDEDTPFTLTAPGLLSNDLDVDGDTLSAVLVSNPARGSVSFNVDGSFTYTPTTDFNGADSFTYQANDGGADSNVVTVTMVIGRVNDAPLAASDSYTTTEDTPLVVTAPGVLGNDSDVDEDTLIVELVDAPLHGSLTLNLDGSFTYTPTADFNGSDGFTYQASDGELNANLGTVSLTVTSVNDTPAATNDSYSTNEDVVLTLPAPGLLANDTDADHDALSAALVSSPAHGSLSFHVDGSFTYTPTANFNGSDSFTYQVNDGWGPLGANSNVATVSLTVTSVNDAPVAVVDSYNTTANLALNPAAPGVLSNDSDPVEGSALTAVLVSAPAHGSLTLNANGSFSYTPNTNYTGSDSFTYKVNDGGADSNVVTVSITVNPAPPVTTTHYATQDAFLRSGNDNTNEGANPNLVIRSDGHNRALLGVNLSGLSGLVSQATLRLYIVYNADNWGNTGRTIDAHRLTQAWTEGNGANLQPGNLTNAQFHPYETRGTGPGVTWKCATDSNVNNQATDCNPVWNGGIYVATPSSTVTIYKDFAGNSSLPPTTATMGWISFDVTADVNACLAQGATQCGWLVKKTLEGQAGRVEFASQEGATALYNSQAGATVTPQLVVSSGGVGAASFRGQASRVLLPVITR